MSVLPLFLAGVTQAYSNIKGQIAGKKLAVSENWGEALEEGKGLAWLLEKKSPLIMDKLGKDQEFDLLA